MASAIDLNDLEASKNTRYDVYHSPYKEEVGKRLSLGAFSLAYNMSVDYAAPRVSSVEYQNPQILVRFISQTGHPFAIKVLHDSGFELCCDSNHCYEDPNQDWQPLTGIKATESGYLFSFNFKKPKDCQRPKYLRYLWRSYACDLHSCPLYSVNSNLPVTPFIYKVGYDSKDHLKNTTVSETSSGTVDFAWGSTTSSSTVKNLNGTTVSSRSIISASAAVSPIASQTSFNSTPSSSRTMSTLNAKASQKANSSDNTSVGAAVPVLADYEHEPNSAFDDYLIFTLVSVFMSIFVFGFFKRKYLF